MNSQPFAIRGHNNVHEDIQHPGLRQLVEATSQALIASGEPFRIRYRSNDGSEVVKVFTLATDHQVHFSLLDYRPGNVHVKFMRFCTVFQDEARAGWTTPKVCDYKPTTRLGFDQKAVETIVASVMDWLTLTADNARSPRTPFLAQDHTSVPPSQYIAATFTVNKVRVTANPKLVIRLSDSSDQFNVELKGDYAQTLNEPTRMVGCRAVVHQSGTVRVLRESNFRQLYELVSSQRKAAKSCMT